MPDNTKQFQQELQYRLFHLLQTVKSDKKWTNKDLADGLGVSVSLIEKWCSNNISSFVKNYFDKISKLAEISGHTTSSLMAFFSGSDVEDDFYSEVVKNLSTTPTSFQMLINDLLKLDIKDRERLATYISFYLKLDSSQKNALEIVRGIMEACND